MLPASECDSEESSCNVLLGFCESEMFEGYRKGDGYDGHLATDAVGLVKRIPLQLGVFQTN